MKDSKKTDKKGNGLLISNGEFKLIKTVINLINRDDNVKPVEKNNKLSFIPASKMK